MKEDFYFVLIWNGNIPPEILKMFFSLVLFRIFTQIISVAWQACNILQTVMQKGKMNHGTVCLEVSTSGTQLNHPLIHLVGLQREFLCLSAGMVPKIPYLTCLRTCRSPSFHQQSCRSFLNSALSYLVPNILHLQAIRHSQMRPDKTPWGSRVARKLWLPKAIVRCVALDASEWGEEVTAPSCSSPGERNIASPSQPRTRLLTPRCQNDRLKWLCYRNCVREWRLSGQARLGSR